MNCYLAFKTFEVANALSLATGGTVAGNTTFNGSLTGIFGNADTATTELMLLVLIIQLMKLFTQHL